MSRLSLGMYLLLLLVATLSSVHRAEAQCPTCDLGSCSPTPTNCQGSVVKDSCGCCDVCAKQSGEACGQDVGVCDIGLSCVSASDAAGGAQPTGPPGTTATTGNICVQSSTPQPTVTGPPATTAAVDACTQISEDWKASYSKWTNLVNNWEVEYNAWKEKNKQTP